MEEVVAGVEGVQERKHSRGGHRGPVGGRVRHRSGALQRQPPARRLRPPRGAGGPSRGTGVRRQRRNRGGAGGGIRRIGPASGPEPGHVHGRGRESAAAWSWAGRSTGGRPAPRGSSATPWWALTSATACRRCSSFRSAARWSRWSPGGSWTAWRRRSLPTAPARRWGSWRRGAGRWTATMRSGRRRMVIPRRSKHCARSGSVSESESPTLSTPSTPTRSSSGAVSPAPASSSSPRPGTLRGASPCPASASAPRSAWRATGSRRAFAAPRC